MGYNIMRIFISDNESSWSQAISTAKLAKSLGLIVFASPWSMPARWKTNNSTAGKTPEGVIGYLKEENYADYAQFLNRFVVLMRDNGVELDAISIQNEPDYDVSYSGCHWTPSQMANFLKNHASTITCKIMAPETVGVSDQRYINALAANDVIGSFDIYAGHQYGGVRQAHKILQEKGKEVWQSEYLINWNADSSIPDRDFDWSIDAFDFSKAINDCMLADVNAWVHYASKRYYAMLGDGLHGTQNSVITKRGHILSHYAKYTIGATRIDSQWNHDMHDMMTSSYLSQTGDSVIVVLINPSNNAFSLTVDLPFYSLSGNRILTTETVNREESLLNFSQETFRPTVDVEASSVSTFIFVKDRERSKSQMNSERIYPDKIESQNINGNFGTDYQLSGKTRVFKNGNPLISSNTSNRRNFMGLNDRYNSLVFRVKSLTSTMNYTSANTTLHYINDAGEVKSHNYGIIAFDRREDFNWVLDISRSVLTDGCSGILSLTNGNYSSELTFEFEEVYFAFGNEKLYEFSGVYSEDDSGLLDCLEDISCTSIDFTATSSINVNEDWWSKATNKNCVYYVNSSVNAKNSNIISGTNCSKLELSSVSGDFYVPVDFTADRAEFDCQLNGYKTLILPFEALIPNGVKAYNLEPSNTEVYASLMSANKIPANKVVLVKGNGNFVFEGSGIVTSPRSTEDNGLHGVYIRMKAPTNSYYLNTDGASSFQKANNSDIQISSFEGYLTLSDNVSATMIPLRVEGESLVDSVLEHVDIISEEYYDLMGRKVDIASKAMQGIYIKKVYFSDGTVLSEKIHLK